MYYNLLYSLSNIFCESEIYLIPYIQNTEYSCSLYGGSITNITVGNYYDLMQMLSLYNLDYSFVGNEQVEGNTSIILRNGNLIKPCDSYVTPYYVFCDIPLSNEDKGKSFKINVYENNCICEKVLNSFSENILKKILCTAYTNNNEISDTLFVSEGEQETVNIDDHTEGPIAPSKEIENTNNNDKIAGQEEELIKIEESKTDYIAIAQNEQNLLIKTSYAIENELLDKKTTQ